MKKNALSRLFAVVIALGAITAANTQAQVPISSGATISENFSTLSTNAVATLPSGWKVDKSTSARTLATYAAALTATERAGGVSLSSTAANGIYNFGSSDTDRAVGGLSSGSASKSVNLYVALQNTGGAPVSSLSVSYNAERYRNGSNAAGFSIQLYYSTDGTTWTSAGANFLSSFAANADNSGSATVPMQTIAVTAQNLPVAIPAGSTLYLAWNYSVTTGSTTSNAQALGVSDIQITAAGAGSPFIASFNPTSGEVGSTVVITGGSFGATPAVRFNGIAASSTVNPEGTEITATVPSGATTGPITVEVAGQPVATSSGNFTVVDPLAPTLSTSGTLSAFNTTVGTPSTSQSFTVSSANLSGNATVTAPTGFEVSSDDSTFGPTASLTPLGGVLTDAPVYVRIASSAAVGPVSGNISVAATGATTQNVAASGTVGALPSYINLVNTNANSYTQNFDSLGTTTISNVVSASTNEQTSLGGVVGTTLDGWYAGKIAGTGTSVTGIVANNGSAISGAVYNYGDTNEPANTDRSLGGLASGSLTPGFGALIKNETGQTLQGVQISFTAKVWRSSTVTNTLTFGYGAVDGSTFTTANFLTAAGASAIPAANVVYVGTNNAAVDGNLPANQITFSNVNVPVSLAPGETMFLRWQDFDGNGSDAGLAIDNVSLTALTGAPPATAPFVAPTSAPANEITRTQAGVSSEVTGDGGDPITVRGFVYSIASVNSTPTIGGTGVTNLPSDTAEVGPMTQTITGLTAGTTYAVRSYASNAVGTTYSAAVTFTTVGPPISFTGTYSESFSTYTGTLPAGWTATSSSNSLAYVGLWGTGSTGGFRGADETTGPVLGYQHTSSTGTLTVSVTFVNDTGSTLDTLDVSYLGRTALPANTRTPVWAVTVAGTLTPTLDYSTGNTDGEGGAPADLELASQVSGLSIAPGAEFTVTWVSERGTEGQQGSSRQIGIADFAISSGGTPPNPYNTWASGFGLDPAATTGPNAGAPTADPDGDSFSNAQEYAFGTNPTQGNGSLLTSTASGGNLVVTWLQRSDVTYNVQSTANLATTAFANDGTVSVVDGPVSPTPPAGYTRKQITVPASGSKFYRVTAATP